MSREDFDAEYPDFDVKPRSNSFGSIWRGTRDENHVGVVDISAKSPSATACFT